MDRIWSAPRPNLLAQGLFSAGLLLFAVAPVHAQDDPIDDPIGDAIEDEEEELSSVRGRHTFRGSGNIRVMGIDFRNTADQSSIIITTDQRISFDSSTPRPGQVLFELHDAALGSGLERRLDTSEFASAVRGISSYLSRSSGSDVRVVVDLDETVDFTIDQQETTLVINFPVPPEIAAAVYEPEPQTSVYDSLDDPQQEEDYQESALLRESLIGGDGEAQDPTRALQSEEGIFGGALGGGNEFTGRRINLDLVNADIHNVFRLISHVSGLNIVSSDQVTGTITVRMIDVPWDQALAAILQAKGLGGTQFGNILRVAPIEVIRFEREEEIAAENARRLLLPLNVLTLPLNYADSAELIALIEPILSERGSVSNDLRTNTIVVRETNETLNKVRRLVRELDTPTPQVLIEARIVEASQTFTRSLGIQWGGHLNFSPSTGSPTGLYFPNDIGVSGGQTAPSVNPNAAGAGAGQATVFTSLPNWVVDLPAAGDSGSLALSLGSLTDVIQLDARLTAAENTGEGRVVSAPRITTVTNQQATIRQGTQIPFETVSLRGTEVQFQEASLELQVTPTITQDGTIFLDIAVSNNRPDFGNTVNSFPTVEIKEAATVVAVRDGDTTVIGGVYSVEDTDNNAMVPGLGRIPVLGWLFKNSSRRMERKELLVFITPTIIDGDLRG